MNYWVCKGRAPNEFHSALKPGRLSTWHTARLPKNFSKGDLIFLWESSPHRRLVGLSRAQNSNRGLDQAGDRLFDQSYLTRRFPSPLGMEELRSIPIVNAAAFLKAGPATVLTALTQEQAEILLDLLAERNPGEVPSSLMTRSKEQIGAPHLAGLLSLTAKEGGKKLFIHYVRERDPRLARAKREAVLAATGGLACEVCDFDFGKRYGSFGEGFCEVHHKQQLSMLKAETEMTIDDLAVVCSNCHRMLHKNGLMKLAELRRRLRKH